MSMITIIVPIYQAAPYLNKCLDSIQAQTYTDFDVILVDDGSNDGSEAICDAYVEKDPRFHVIHKENGGVSTSRNVGLDWALAESDSKYITFIDSDDWVHPRYLHVLYRTLVKSGCKVCMGWIQEVDDYSTLPEKATKAYSIKSPVELYCQRFGNFVMAAAKLYRKDEFATLRFPLGKIHEDEFIVWKILFQYDQIAVPEAPIYAYYLSPGSIMRSEWAPHKLVLLEAIEEEKEYFFSLGNQELIDKICQRQVKICTAQLDGMRRTGYDPEEIRRYRQKLKEYVKESRGAMGFEIGFRAYVQLYPALGPLYWIYRVPYRCRRKYRHIKKKLRWRMASRRS